MQRYFSRQTGKSAYIRNQLTDPPAAVFSLLDQRLLLSLLADPTRIRQEIEAEGLVRNLPAFARFLETAATANAELINYSNIARDAQVARQTVVQWFTVLTDTLLAFLLPPYTGTRQRKAIETAKFYFFDTGVVRTLRRIPHVHESSRDFGAFFEHYIFLELKSWIDYKSPGPPFIFGGQHRVSK